jgi:Superfamily II helicase, archaea-specific
MGDEYLLYAYPGDILSFLDSAVRTLEAAETLAEVDANSTAGARAQALKTALER